MTTDDFKAQLRTVNESGFPLLIAVVHLINTIYQWWPRDQGGY